MKTNVAINGGISVTHGTAVWSIQILESMDSFRIVESRVGVLTGEQMMAGVDVDAFVGEIWQATEQNGFMELRLMLSSGQVVEIDSIRDAVGCQVLAVRFDEAKFPAGLEGRWLERLAGKMPAKRKNQRNAVAA